MMDAGQVVMMAMAATGLALHGVRRYGVAPVATTVVELDGLTVSCEPGGWRAWHTLDDEGARRDSDTLDAALALALAGVSRG